MNSAIIVASRYAILPLVQYGPSFRHTHEVSYCGLGAKADMVTRLGISELWGKSELGIQARTRHFS
jgi:hypothetical protein